MQSPNRNEYENIYEIRFKNTRKGFYRNVNGLSLITGDFVVVESDRGYDVGQVSLGGILAELQMKKKKVNKRSDRIRKIYRMASKEDLEKLKLARSREQETLVRTRVIVRNLNLDMKMSDVEFQGDNTKAIFYYIADSRVDFRELIKILANDFRIRVEMKQIGLRFESGLVGGIGSCGRELCCSTWLTDFKSVSTSAARYQNLSLNPMKISGQCGRLKCCLNYELDTYLDALEDIPKVEKLDTEAGLAYLQKVDIFKQIMWFCYEKETTWIPVRSALVKEISEMNAEGQKPASLRSMEENPIGEQEVSIDFVDVVGQAVLREEPKRKKRKKKKKRPGTAPKAGGGQRNARGKGQGRNDNRSKKRNEGERKKEGEKKSPQAKSNRSGQSNRGGGAGKGGKQARRGNNSNQGGGTKGNNRNAGNSKGGNARNQRRPKNGNKGAQKNSGPNNPKS